MPLAMTDRVVVRPDVIFRALGAEAIVLNLDGGLYFGLDEVGCRLWTLLERCDLEGASRELCGEFEVSIEQARQDVAAFVQTLIDRRLVSIAGDSA